MVAAYVLGFAGFGFALISLPSLALLLPPSEFVPALYSLLADKDGLS